MNTQLDSVLAIKKKINDSIFGRGGVSKIEIEGDDCNKKTHHHVI